MRWFKLIHVFALGFLLINQLNGQELFSKTYTLDGTTDLEIIALDVTPTGDNLLLAQLLSANNGLDDVSYGALVVLRTDADGDLEWARSYGGGQTWENTYGLAATTDDGFVLLAYANTQSLNENPIWIKCNSDGTIDWTRGYINPPLGFSTDVTILPNGNFLLCGEVQNGVLLQETTPEGGLDYGQVYRIPLADVAFSDPYVTVLGDESRVLVGAYLNFNTDALNSVIAKINADGTVSWAQQLVYPGQTVSGQDVLIFSNGDLLFVQYTEQVVVDPTEEIGVILTRLDTAGTLQWTEFVSLGDADGATPTQGGAVLTTPNYLGCAIDDNDNVLLYAEAELSQDGESRPYLIQFTATGGFVRAAGLYEPGFQHRATLLDNGRNQLLQLASDGTIILGSQDNTTAQALALTRLGSDLTAYCTESPSVAVTEYLPVVEEVLMTSGNITALVPVDIVVSELAFVEDDITVSPPLSQILTLGPDQTLCADELVLVPETIVPGSYEWNTGATTPSISVDTPGTYILTYSLNECFAVSDTVVVLPSQGLSLAVTGNEPGCTGTLLNLTASTNATNITWQDAMGEVLGNGSQLSRTLSVSETITVMVADNCTEFTEVVELIALPNPVPNVEVLIPSCGLDNGALAVTALTGLSPYILTWSGPGEVDLSDPFSLADAPPGAYTLIVTDANTCSDTSTYILPESTALTFAVNVIAPSCLSPNGGSVVLDNATGTFPLTLTLNGSSPISGNTLSEVPPGDYTLLVSDASGCDDLVDFTMPLPVTPVVSIGNGTTDLSLGTSIQLLGQTNLNVNGGEGTVSWSPVEGLSCADCLQPEVTPLATQTYTLTVTAADGCQVSAGIQLVVDTNVPVYVPNVFSPNADGRNDRFVVFPGAGVAQVETVRVFDRWGSLMYEANNNEGWDGNIAGQLAPVGTYIYQVTVRLIDGRREVLFGDVVILR